jgi:hypothetical protein
MSTYGNVFPYCEVLAEIRQYEIRWPDLGALRLTNEQFSWSAHSTVRAIRSTMPKNMACRTDNKIMEKLYNEDDALSDFL